MCDPTRYAHDKSTPDHLKVHEVFQLLKASLGKVAKGRRVMAPPGYEKMMDAAGMSYGVREQRSLDGVFTQVTEVFEPRNMLAGSQQQQEARANAERSLAVQMIVNKEAYEAMANAGTGDAKGKKDEKKGGGKKKK